MIEKKNSIFHFLPLTSRLSLRSMTVAAAVAASAAGFHSCGDPLSDCGCGCSHCCRILIQMLDSHTGNDFG